MSSKSFKHILLASIATLSFTIAGCSKKLEIRDIEDKYRTMYQIFPISYADSNGDGYGDLKGIADKLDYIKDMNYTGIWLTPIHKSPSYHKYDVNDYKSIDPVFGTIDDYDNLVKKCHENNMTIILDLVINHSSDINPWFIEACNARRNKDTENRYYNYYNFKTLGRNDSVPTGWTKVSGTSSLVYESRFNSGMPDLNLQAVLDDENSYLAQDLKDIMKFWLVDHDIDGFRLDAVTSYFTGSIENNKNILTWINKTAKSLKPDCYIVGEGSWNGNSSENLTYQESGIDSFFMFGNAGANGVIGASIKQQNAKLIYSGLQANKKIAGDGIPAPFIANHDTGRAVGSVAGRTNSNNAKFGNGVLQMLAGATFTYYGDEIGMAVSQSGVNNDPNKRLPMDWGDGYTCKNPSGTIAYEHDESYPYDDVKTQLKDKNSILNYVKKVNLIRRQFPQIARGDFEYVYDNVSGSLGVIKRTYKGESIYCAINTSITSSSTFELSQLDAKEEIKLLTEVSVNGKCKQSGKKITVPAQGIAIIG